MTPAEKDGVRKGAKPRGTGGSTHRAGGPGAQRTTKTKSGLSKGAKGTGKGTGKGAGKDTRKDTGKDTGKDARKAAAPKRQGPPGAPAGMVAEGDGVTDEEALWASDIETATIAPDAALLSANLRDLGAPERADLESLLARYGDDILTALGPRWTFKVLERADVMPHRRIVALDAARLADLAPYKPVFLGIPIAHLARKGARLTLEGGKLIAPHASRRVVRADEKGTQLFLYGRHLLARSIRRVLGKPGEGDEVLVLDDHDGRYLGIGIADAALVAMRASTGRPGPQDLVVNSRLDLGLYLRAQQAVPE